MPSRRGGRLGAGALLLAVVGAGKCSVHALLGGELPWLATESEPALIR